MKTNVFVEKFVKSKGGKTYCKVYITIGNKHLEVGDFAADNDLEARSKAHDVLVTAINLL